MRAAPDRASQPKLISQGQEPQQRPHVRAPRFHPNSTHGDWYLQHLELLNTLPALIVGYIAARVTTAKASTWGWTAPAIATLLRKKSSTTARVTSLLGNPKISIRQKTWISKVQLKTPIDPFLERQVRLWKERDVLARQNTAVLQCL